MASEPMKTAPASSTGAENRRANLRLAWILASVAIVFFIGFVAKIALFGPR